MDEDVELNLKQAHEKWITKMVVLAVLSFFVLIAFWVHDCNAPTSEKPCTDATFNPVSYSTIVCPDRRQTLSSPPGWTWIKCACPESR